MRTRSTPDALLGYTPICTVPPFACPKKGNLQCNSVVLNDDDDQDSILPTSIILVLIYRTNLRKYGHLGIALNFIGS